MKKPDSSQTTKLRGLYAVTMDDPLLPRLSALVQAALEGGVGLVQYRNKTAPRALRRAQAAELLRHCRARGARLIINDDIELAIELGADGVHVGRDEMADRPLEVIRERIGPFALLGVSCYNELERAEAAARAGADYIAFGSMYGSQTKPDAAKASLNLLAEARRFGLPVAAIGGITLERVPELMAAGADMVAVITDLFDAMDVQARAAAYQKFWNEVDQGADCHKASENT